MNKSRLEDQYHLPEGYVLRKLPQTRQVEQARNVRLHYRPVGILAVMAIIVFLQLHALGVDMLSNILSTALIVLLAVMFS